MAQRRFYVPEDKPRELEAILRDAIDPTRETSREVYEHVRSSTTSQPVHKPHVPPDSFI